MPINFQQIIQVINIVIGIITFFGGWFVAHKILTNDFVHLDANVKEIKTHLGKQDENIEKIKDSVNYLSGTVIELKTKVEERTQRTSVRRRSSK